LNRLRVRLPFDQTQQQAHRTALQVVNIVPVSEVVLFIYHFIVESFQKHLLVCVERADQVAAVVDNLGSDQVLLVLFARALDELSQGLHDLRAQLAGVDVDQALLVNPEDNSHLLHEIEAFRVQDAVLDLDPEVVLKPCVMVLNQKLQEPQNSKTILDTLSLVNRFFLLLFILIETDDGVKVLCSLSADFLNFTHQVGVLLRKGLLD
jgi:hypothetical protein